MSKSWDKDWADREAQRRAKTDRLMDMVKGDLDARDVDRSLARRQAREDVPTFSECVIGYRQWSVDALDQLWPLTVRQRPWQPGINDAVCDRNAHHHNYFLTTAAMLYGAPSVPVRPPKRHSAPHKDCECGLYAWRCIRPEWITREGQLREPHMPPVVGAVAFWGDVRVHREGFRAEKACIVALAYRAERPEVAAVVARVAARYRAEVVLLDDLEIAASRYGTPLPDSMQPPAPKPTYYGAFQQLLPGPIYYTSNSANVFVTPPGP